MVLVISPKVTWEKSATGAPHCARLSTLKVSTWNRNVTLSPNDTSFASARSTCEIDGARKALRPRLPNVPLAGTENAAGFTHSWGVDPPGGVSGTPQL